jgi:hypothetical protein
VAPKHNEASYQPAQQHQLLSTNEQHPAPQDYPQDYPQQASAHQRYDSVQDPHQRDHTKRNTAAAVGVAGAGAGAYEYSKQDAEIERQQDERAKEYQKQQKELEKQQAKQQKEHDKLVAAEEKKHHKEAEKHQKEVEKEEARQQKEMDKEEQGEKKKHHLFGFLHRDKKDKEKGEGSDSGSPRHSKEYAAAGAGASEATLDSPSEGTPRTSLDHKGRNRLHKDPPKGHPAREAMEASQQGYEQQHMGIDGPIGRPGEISGDQ